jgi:hypothetical protein
MNIVAIRELLKQLAKAPPGLHAQIDETICAKLDALSNADTITAVDMKAILDECAFASLASDFAMIAMDIVWKELLKQETVATT